MSMHTPAHKFNGISPRDFTVKPTKGSDFEIQRELFDTDAPFSLDDDKPLPASRAQCNPDEPCESCQ